MKLLLLCLLVWVANAQDTPNKAEHHETPHTTEHHETPHTDTTEHHENPNKTEHHEAPNKTEHHEAPNKTEHASGEASHTEHKTVEAILSKVEEEKVSDWVQDWVEPGSVCKLKSPLTFPWMWECREGACLRTPVSEATNGMTLGGCKLTCGKGLTLWPKPTGTFTLGKTPVSFKYSQVIVIVDAPQDVRGHVEKAGNRLKETLRDMRPPGGSCLELSSASDANLATRQLTIRVTVEQSDASLTLKTDESYKLNITHTDADQLEAHIEAKTFFGARHGMETLSQLVAYDDANDALMTVTADVRDAPVYPVRALTLDTSRNFISVAGLRRTIGAMAMNKLNTLHWHITDTHSFPIEITGEPRLAQYGAYSPREVYTRAEVEELVQFALERGVRLLPELDMPAHVGYGWQWGEKAGMGNLTVCLGKEPWQQFCVEPPCGQMNIINENLYKVLKTILVEYNDVFQPDLFHIGGDEINLNCWKTTPEIAAFVKEKGGDPTDDEEYMKLWIQFQERVYDMWTSIAGEQKTILWTSHLTQRPAEESRLDPSKYIIQIWTTGKDQQIGDLLKQGYELILSNYDAWYLDCGGSAWVGKGNNWCSPYKSWQTVYENSPRKIAQSFQSSSDAAASQPASQSDFSAQILGGSAALWTEQADDANLDNKLWPRGAALAERLWAEPDTDSLAAQWRLVHHRRRMVARGVHAETMQPKYCHQYDGTCYID
ncbi:chitooligosaccharidolytic beta-N-acetylglucosaminidase-like [Amphibalanus amphitrite]|uniref:chitooligosaccharidolytic beta-N-acetylglucosaminidase-like n=1 Tax=Amphibalanus amphitrite TaxID=1232801 RepID=UPI001C91748A|nr:chitooligosaccharidolytic beta-N-acetylglucosaminidase-like [Amphibalanus amphitrite]